MTEQPIRLLQITDSHLFADPEARLLGLDTDESFLAVVQLAEKESQGKTIGAVLATGDIAQDASERAYLYYQKVIQQFSAPVLWLPGNHDNVKTMRKCVHNAPTMLSPCVHDLGSWSVIMLDSSIETDVCGRLNQEHLDFLDQALAAKVNQHCMVCLHHHPIDCGSHWLDGHNLKNAYALWQVLHRHQNVKALVWGHIHQEFYRMHEHGEQRFPCYAPPSTCIQFKPNHYDFSLDQLNPGYRWFDLYPDGRLVTSVSRTAQCFEQDMKSTGY